MTPEELANEVGCHPSAELGLRSGEIGLSGGGDANAFSDEALDRWLVACCLLGHGVDVARSCASVHALEAAGLAMPSAIAKGDALAVESALLSAGHPKAEQSGLLLLRVCRALEDRYGGSLAALAGAADDLEELAGRLMGLAPGFGRAAVVRLLRPLRDTWPLVDEIPLDPAARAAAVHLGWIRDGQDEDGAPGALRAFLRSADGAATHFCDVEAALERLGRKACLRERSDRCPLGSRCPRREVARVAERPAET